MGIGRDLEPFKINYKQRENSPKYHLLIRDLGDLQSIFGLIIKVSKIITFEQRGMTTYKINFKW